MRESRIRQYLPAMASVFARCAAAAMILWFDHETPVFDDEINADELERRKTKANARWVRGILTDCQRVMLEALESAELQKIVSAMEGSRSELDPAESGQ